MALKKVITADLENTAKQTAAVSEKQTVHTPEPEVNEPETSAEVDQQEAGGQTYDHDDSPSGDESGDEGEDNAQATSEVDTGVQPEGNDLTAEQAAEAVVTPTTGSAVALKPDNTAVSSVSEQKKSAMQTFTQDAADQGFEGLVLTGMSFDRLKLNDKEFQLGIDETSLGNRIEFALMATRPVYIIRQHDRKGAELFYSYDKEGRTNTDGTSAQDVLDKWAEDGYGGPNLAESGNEPLSVKEYIEATAQLKNRTDEHDEAVVMMSIPPASKQKLGGAVAVGQMKYRKTLGRTPAIGEMLYEAKVGPKVGSGEEAFNPWIFNAIGLLDQQ